ncbi:hypothetical protein KVR01_013627 [Diaporthe batatas]|uniref:uncharacterized protein n=1 Tax=Diaporthe batatas TaxID=748121 RepID=UPI001D05BA10|nr:uncharacterized protein KVR01_013627 [Diaporthe batatas]KAG8156523.1 hypothetical protein KVR01_013627 [Diaporthe batatas]
MQFAVLIASLAIGAIASPAPAVTPAPKARDIQKRLNVPASSGSTVFEEVKTVASGDTFDGGMKVYDRGVSCTGQVEGGDSDAVFQIENGGTLKNVIIGPNQIEGVHCQGACTLENVWWPEVCEDAFTIKNQDAGETTYIKGGGAAGAEDKVLQHNGGGSLEVSDFEVEDFGKLYRSCGNCKTMYERHFTISGSTDTKTSGVKDVCVTYDGTEDNDKEPVKNDDNGDGCDGTFCVC